MNVRTHFRWSLQLHPALLAALLPVGVAITVAVAWGGALVSDLGKGNASELYAELDGGHHWQVYRWDSAVGTRVFSSCWTGLSVGPYNHGDPAKLLPGWSRLTPQDAAAPQVQSDVQDGWGFPFRSLGCRSAIRLLGSTPQTTTTGSIPLRSPRHVGDRGLYLPLEPLWGGFAGNSLLNGLLSMVIAAGARDLRRAYRGRGATPGP